MLKFCRIGDVEFVVCRDDNGKIHAFHNVCRHHASILATGSGNKSCFVCPYHVSTHVCLNSSLLFYVVVTIKAQVLYLYMSFMIN